MDGMASTEERTPPLAAASSEESVSVEVEQRQQSAPLPAVVKAKSGGEEDEQVERFFALLDNIRALRTMYGASSSNFRGRKRVRDAEPPWKPAFRMEDFEEQQQDCAAGKKKKTVEGRWADDGKEEDGEVVETHGFVGSPRPGTRG